MTIYGVLHIWPAAVDQRCTVALFGTSQTFKDKLIRLEVTGTGIYVIFENEGSFPVNDIKNIWHP